MKIKARVARTRANAAASNKKHTYVSHIFLNTVIDAISVSDDDLSFKNKDCVRKPANFQNLIVVFCIPKHHKNSACDVVQLPGNVFTLMVFY